MSESVENGIDPFDASVLDEETELSTLARSIDLAKGFKLYFARCNQPQQRNRLISQIKEKLPDLKIQEVHFSEPIPHLLDALSERLEKQSYDAVFVSGIENSMPAAAKAFSSELVANLNASRNSFPQMIRCPIVLWMPEYALTALSQGSSDFFTIRSGVFFFAATHQETFDLYRYLTNVNQQNHTSGLTSKDLYIRIKTVKDLISDYSLLSLDTSNQLNIARLYHNLSTLYLSSNQWIMAGEAIDTSINIYDKLNQLSMKAAALVTLGKILNYQGRWNEEERAYRESLSIFSRTDSILGKNLAQGALGSVLDRLGKHKEAEISYLKALDLQRIGLDAEGEIATLNNLGILYANTLRWSEAENSFLESISKARLIQNSLGVAYALSSISRVYAVQNRLRDAESSLDESLKIFESFQDKHNTGHVLNNLSNIYRLEGRLAEAEISSRLAVENYHEIGDVIGEGKALINLSLTLFQLGKIQTSWETLNTASNLLKSTEDSESLHLVDSLLAQYSKLMYV